MRSKQGNPLLATLFNRVLKGYYEINTKYNVWQLPYHWLAHTDEVANLSRTNDRLNQLSRRVIRRSGDLIAEKVKSKSETVCYVLQ